MSFTSCERDNIQTQNDDTSSKNIADMYFVYYSQKINIETGNVTPLCTDPLCSHKQDECQFFRIATEGSVTVRNGNKLVYSGAYLTENDDPNNPIPFKTQNAIISYDLLKNTITKHYDLPGNNVFSSFRVFDGHIFLRVTAAPEEIKKPEAEDYTTQTLIINVEDNTQKLSPNINSQGYVLLDYTGEQIYYIDDAYKYHVIDIEADTDTLLEFEELSDKAKKYEYIYIKWNNVSEEEKGVWKKFSDGSHKLIIPGAIHAKDVGDLIVYPMLNPQYETNYENGRLTYFLDIWACNPDGSEPRKIFENPGNIKMLYTFYNEAQAAGNSFGIPCLELIEDEKGDMVPLHSRDTDGYNSFFMLDTLTGEYKTVAVRNINDGTFVIPAS